MSRRSVLFRKAGSSVVVLTTHPSLLSGAISTGLVRQELGGACQTNNGNTT